MFVIKAEQLHMVATGAALVLTASGVAIIETVPGRALKAATVLVLAGAITAMASVSRHAIASVWFGPARMHHVQLRIPYAWIPALVIPRSQDTRTLGLQVGAIDVR